MKDKFILDLEDFVTDYFINDEENGLLNFYVNDVIGEFCIGVIELTFDSYRTNSFIYEYKKRNKGGKPWQEISEMITNFIEILKEYYQVGCVKIYTATQMFNISTIAYASEAIDKQTIANEYFGSPIEYIRITVYQ